MRGWLARMLFVATALALVATSPLPPDMVVERSPTQHTTLGEGAAKASIDIDVTALDENGQPLALTTVDALLFTTVPVGGDSRHRIRVSVLTRPAQPSTPAEVLAAFDLSPTVSPSPSKVRLTFERADTLPGELVIQWTVDAETRASDADPDNPSGLEIALKVVE